MDIGEPFLDGLSGRSVKLITHQLVPSEENIDLYMESHTLSAAF
jgi:hypothetical protein